MLTIKNQSKKFKEEKISPKRVIGQYRGKLVIPNSFFEPLPKSIEKAFNDPK